MVTVAVVVVVIEVVGVAKEAVVYIETSRLRG